MISQLGRVTLFAGKNGVGKTTLLEAVRIYASRSEYSVLEQILQGREEFVTTLDEDGHELLIHDWRSLFHGRALKAGTSISIGPEITDQKLNIKIAKRRKEDSEQWSREIRENFVFLENDLKLVIEYDKENRSIPMGSFGRRTRFPSGPYRKSGPLTSGTPEIKCVSLDPGLLDNASMVRFWDNVALTDNEQDVVAALRLGFGDRVERVAVVGDDTRHSYNRARRVIVKVQDQQSPIPLRSLGEGAVRFLGVALALTNSTDGFLVIDEAENGIHHTVQRDFWNMVLEIAHKKNIQVFATTHSWDCVVGFAQASKARKDVDGRLVRLESEDDGVRAVEYPEDQLHTATEQHIEVR